MTSHRLLWEQHTCLPLSTRARVGQLRRYQRDGGTFASVNVGYAPHGADEVLAAFRAGVALEEGLVLGDTVAAVDGVHRDGGVAVAFDLEDSGPLEGDLGLVRSSSSWACGRCCRRNPELFPESYTRWGPVEFLPPEGLLRVEAALEARGYPPDAVTAILGGNFRRVAADVWGTPATG